MDELQTPNGCASLPSTSSRTWNLHWPRGPWAFCAALALIALTLHIVAVCTWRQDVKVVGGCQPTGNLSKTAITSHKFVITYCGKSGSQKSGQLTATFPSGTRRIVLEVVDHGKAAGNFMELVSRSGTIKPLAMPATDTSVTRETISVPHSIRQAPFNLVMHDRSPDRSSWAGIAVDGYSSLYVNLDALATATLIVLLLHFVLVELGTLLLRLTNGEYASNLAVLGLGLVSFAAFWLYYASRTAGITFSIFFLLGLAASAAWRTLGRQHNIPSFEQRKLQAAIAPVATLTLLLLIIGFYPFPEHWSFWQYVANRWQSLPIDNWLPKIFADQVWNGHVNHPMIGDWLSSDRPPLQAGFYLLLRPLAPNDQGTLYQVAAVYLQATILIPLASIISTLRLERVRGITLLLISTSALVIYNGTFVWPKLIAATYCLVAYAALFSWAPRNANRVFPICMAAIAAALAMLSHGGAIFALLSIFAVYCVIGGWRQWPALLVGAGAAAAIYVPWMLYQHLIDPPGTRLIAWMLAGQIAPTSVPITKVLYDAYSHLTLDQWWHARLANVATVCHGMVNFFTDAVNLVSAPRAHGKPIVVNSFFYFFFSQWFLSPLLAIASAALGWKRVRTQLRQVLVLTAVVFCGLVVWCVLMYSPGTTIIHQGAYFLNIASLLLCMLCIYSFSRYVFLAAGVANLIVFVAAFALSQRTLTGSIPPLPVDLLNADRLPTGSALYIFVLVLALAFHYWACCAKRSRLLDARNGPDAAVLKPGKNQAC